MFCLFLQGTGVGEPRNPSDPASQGLKTAKGPILTNNTAPATTAICKHVLDDDDHLEVTAAAASASPTGGGQSGIDNHVVLKAAADENDAANENEPPLSAFLGEAAAASGDNNKTVRLRFHARPAGLISLERTGALDTSAGAFWNNSASDGGGGLLPSWDAVLWRGRLYVYVSARQLSEGSKVG